MADLERKLVTTLCTSIREGLASLRIAEFLNKKLRDLGRDVGGVPGGVFLIDTGNQTTISGVGSIFDEFLRSGKIENYTGSDEQPTQMFDKKNYHTAACRLMTFDQTFYRMPYDCRSRMFILNPLEVY